MSDSPQVIIVGAGLTGLTTAYYLTKAGYDVLVLEKLPRTGGVIQTGKELGFIYETGPNSGVVSNPEIAELLEELRPLCIPETANYRAGTRWVMKGGSFKELPKGLISGITTPLFTATDKIRILFEPLRKRGDNPDETIQDLVLRRLGHSFYDYAVDPFISGIYAGDPSRLVTRYAIPKLYKLEQNYGSFIRGAIKKASEQKEPRDLKATKDIFSMKGGLSNLTEALVTRIGEEKIQCSAQEIHIASIPVGGVRKTLFDTGTERFKVTARINGELRDWTAHTVVTTTGAHALPSLLPSIASKQMNVLNNARYAKVVQVILGYKRWEGIPLQAFGGLIPSRELKNILGVLFTSSFLSQRAPQGGALLSVYLGGIRHPEYVSYTDEQLIKLSLQDVEPALRPNGKPTLTRVFRHEHAIPQYEQSTGARLAMVEQVEQEHPGLVIGGNLRNGIGIADRVKQGKEIAERILKAE